MDDKEFSYLWKERLKCTISCQFRLMHIQNSFKTCKFFRIHKEGRLISENFVVKKRLNHYI